MSPDQSVIDNCATDLQRIVKDVDLKHPCGWVVDLSEDGGGNMWPMLARLGPILGEGKLGAFVDPDGASTDWSYRDGRALEGNESRARVTEAAYRLNAVAPPVAVLTSVATASSAEALTAARDWLLNQPACRASARSG